MCSSSVLRQYFKWPKQARTPPLGEVRSLFDRVALLDGTVTALDTPDAVLASDAFERAFGISAR